MRISDDTAGRIVHLVSTAVEGVLERARALIAGYDAELGREIPAGTEIFDAHVHLGNDIDGFSGVYEDLERINDRYGIRRCFVFCMDEPDRHPAFRAANDRTLEHAKRAGGRLIPFVRLDLAELAGYFGGKPGVFFDTSVWSPIDLLSLLHLVAPEQIVYASDYPYGQQPSSLLIAIRTAKRAGFSEDQLRAMLWGNASRIAEGEEPLEPTPPRGGGTFSQPMAFARIHQYLSMATPLLWTRQADTIGVLGLALNATADRDGNVEERERIRELLETARDLWRTLPELEDEAEQRIVSRTTFRLVHLAEMLRGPLGLTGTKIACGEGHCGSCTVQLDGVPVLSCITLVHTVGEREVTTIEGLRDHPLVDAFVRADALQCGFCTPGQIVSAAALVEADPEPTPGRIRHAMAGNLCRCGTYPRIEEALLTWQD